MPSARAQEAHWTPPSLTYLGESFAMLPGTLRCVCSAVTSLTKRLI